MRSCLQKRIVLVEASIFLSIDENVLPKHLSTQKTRTYACECIQETAGHVERISDCEVTVSDSLLCPLIETVAYIDIETLLHCIHDSR